VGAATNSMISHLLYSQKMINLRIQVRQKM
jgi:hypothetical protein